MKRFVVACPKGSRTGGPEALHQLVAALSSTTVEAVLWDPYSVDGDTETSNYYPQYGVQWADSPPEEGDVLVVPEVWGELIPQFYGHCQCVFWWLSVDNFFIANKYPLDVLLRLFPKVIHAAQSHYAQDFLGQQGVESVLLTDYINPEFIAKHRNNFSSSETVTKQFDIAINPAKGFDRASKVMTACQNLNFVLLEKMSREEVISSLSSSKIYLDLGTHPGVDRIPREAALLGCVIVTNKRGSAGNLIDIAIDEGLFKHSDEEFGFEVSIQQALWKILSTLEGAKSKQKNYVAWITEAEKRFKAEALSLVSKIDRSDYLTSEFEKSIADCVDLAYRHRDRLSVERDQLVVDRDRLSVDRDQLVVDRDRLSVERDQLVVDRDRLSVERDQLTNELSAIKGSKIWKFTYPVRAIGPFVRKLIGITD
jgi:hypothetical protein